MSITYVGINDISTRSFSILSFGVFLLEMLSKSSSKFEIRNVFTSLDFHPVKNNFRRAYLLLCKNRGIKEYLLLILDNFILEYMGHFHVRILDVIKSRVCLFLCLTDTCVVDFQVWKGFSRKSTS